MKLSTLQKNSLEWSQFSSSEIDDSTVQGDDRLAASLLHLSLEHYSSILHLIKAEHIGSAKALLRPQFESLVRGRWFHKNASKEAKQSFIEGKEPPSAHIMITQIDASSSSGSSGLLGLKKSIGGVLNSFTHGGIEQASHRITNDEIVGDHSDEVKSQVIHLSNALGLDALANTCAMTENESASIAILDKYRSLELDGWIGLK